MKKALLLVAISMAITLIGFSAKAPVKFGKIDKEFLEMTVCDIDSTASAVVLCDYGYFNGSTFSFTRLVRIKILSKEGYEWADRVFTTSSKANIRGITYNLENGEVVEEKLKRSSIFVDKVYDDLYQMRVSMPNVRVGSVIDIEFTYSWLPSSWYFQRTIPVLHSELYIEKSIYLTFRKNFIGNIRLSESTDDRWIAKNVPAFREEPYMSSIENYISKFEIEIMKVSYPGLFINFSQSWGGVAGIMMGMEHFGLPLKSFNNYIKGWAKEIEEEPLTDEQKVMAAVDKMHDVKWNQIEWKYTTLTEFKYQYSKGVGNSTDINLGLVVLLRKLGFESYAVALSTRSNGLIYYGTPSLQKLNYVVASVKLDNNFILIDATDELLPYNLLPERCLNYTGRIVDEDGTKEVKIEIPGKHKVVAQYNLTMNKDLSIDGTINYANYEYAAYDVRKEMELVADIDEYIDAYNADKEGLIINEAEYSNVEDVYKPVKEKYDITIESLGTQSDSIIYLPCMEYEKMDENPFNSSTRLYPIDFIYPVERSGVITINLPPNVEVLDVPKPLRLAMPDKSMDYIYSLSTMGNKVILNYRLRIVDAVIRASEYDKMRIFFEYITEKEAEPIILKIK
mgnify:CR=1 FL=1